MNVFIIVELNIFFLLLINDDIYNNN